MKFAIAVACDGFDTGGKPTSRRNLGLKSSMDGGGTGFRAIKCLINSRKTWLRVS
ncbi:MAG: hypothetical protein ACPGRD_08695 [Planktomarina sp.]